MKAFDTQLDDIELRTELAILLGWHNLRRDSTGVLLGDLRGFRFANSLPIPNWTGDPHQVEGIEDELNARKLQSHYVRELVRLGHIDPNDEAGKFQFFAEAPPRLRCEAALVTLRNASARELSSPINH